VRMSARRSWVLMDCWVMIRLLIRAWKEGHSFVAQHWELRIEDLKFEIGEGGSNNMLVRV